MDDVTQHNAALVEENAATAKMLDHQAQTMAERVSLFRLEEEPARSRATRLALSA
jgi:methyl-accepting chemotaxis protein